MYSARILSSLSTNLLDFQIIRCPAYVTAQQTDGSDGITSNLQLALE